MLAVIIITLMQFATESGVLDLTVVESLAMARTRGGVYRVVCQTGQWAGQHCVLKHGGRPEELAQVQERRVDTSNWHHVSFWTYLFTECSKNRALHCSQARLLQKPMSEAISSPLA